MPNTTNNTGKIRSKSTLLTPRNGMQIMPGDSVIEQRHVESISIAAGAIGALCELKSRLQEFEDVEFENSAEEIRKLYSPYMRSALDSAIDIISQHISGIIDHVSYQGALIERDGGDNE